MPEKYKPSDEEMAEATGRMGATESKMTEQREGNRLLETNAEHDKRKLEGYINGKKVVLIAETRTGIYDTLKEGRKRITTVNEWDSAYEGEVDGQQLSQKGARALWEKYADSAIKSRTQRDQEDKAEEERDSANQAVLQEKERELLAGLL